MKKRTCSDIWKNMYDFPCIEPMNASSSAWLEPGEFNDRLQLTIPGFSHVSEPIVHILSPQRLHIRFNHWHAEMGSALPFLLVPLSEVRNCPVPRPVEQYLVHFMDEVFNESGGSWQKGSAT